MKVPRCLKKISPNWYELLKRCAKMSQAYSNGEGVWVGDLFLDIDSSQNCIVGEAYGFTNIYNDEGKHECVICDNLSMQFACAINPRHNPEDYGLDKRPKSLKFVVEIFCKHFRNKHGDLMKC